MKKTFGKIVCMALSLTMCAGFAFGTAACGESGGGGDDVTLVIWLPQEDRQYAEEVTAAFQAEHPEKNYTFLFGAQPESDAGTAVLNDVSNAPDLFGCASDHLRKLYNGGAINRLGGALLNRLNNEIDADAMEAATLDVAGEKQTYGIPYTYNTYFLFYNKAKLNEEDVKTVDGILAKCSEKEQFGYPLNDGWYSSAFLFGAGVTYDVEYDANFGEVKIDTTLDGADGIAAAQAMGRYSNNAGFKGDSNDSKIVAGFEDGSIIAGVSGVWNLKSIEAILGDDMGIAPLPTYTFNTKTNEQKPLKAFAGYKLMCVCNYSKVKTDALLLAEYFCNYDNQMKHFDMRSYTPTNKKAMQEQKVQDDLCASVTLQVMANSQSAASVPTTWWTPLESLGNAMITTTMTDDSVIQQVKAAVTNIRKGV